MQTTTIMRPTTRPGNGNPGIVPPWLQNPNRNPGIVPPWLQGRPVGPTIPVDDDTPQIFGAANTRTVFEPLPVAPDDPEIPRIMRG